MKEKFFDWFHHLVLVVARFLDRLFSTSKENAHPISNIDNSESVLETLRKSMEEKHAKETIPQAQPTNMIGGMNADRISNGSILQWCSMAELESLRCGFSMNGIPCTVKTVTHIQNARGDYLCEMAPTGESPREEDWIYSASNVCYDHYNIGVNYSVNVQSNKCSDLTEGKDQIE